MAIYKLAKDADFDLKNIYKFGFTQFGESAADKYLSMLFEEFEHIAQNPLSFEIVAHIRRGYRRRSLKSHSIYYRLVDDDTVEIVRILGRQSLDELSK